MRLRAATDNDASLLAVATLGNLNWNGPRFTLDQVDAEPAFRHYVAPWPGHGDFGLVAEEDDGEAIGVVWLKHFPADDPGYGSVEPSIPELSIHVNAAHRGSGVGTALLTAALDEARARGLAAISLSVEEGNPTMHLYSRLGFRPAGPDHEPGTYLVAL
jgi:GNAT superfamily N-acetyltransferase